MVNLNELDTYDTETLKTLLQDWKKFTQKVVDDLNDLRDENLILRADIKELQRMYCHAAATIGRCTPSRIAEQQGWSCFK
jgi:hypothetical protein